MSRTVGILRESRILRAEARLFRESVKEAHPRNGAGGFFSDRIYKMKQNFTDQNNLPFRVSILKYKKIQ